MGLHLYLQDDEGLRARTLENAKDIFEAKPPKPQLEVTRAFEAKGTTCVLGNQDISSVSDIWNLQRKSDVSSQIFIIRQDRSWTSLNVSLELFESFLQIYNVFPQIWKYAFTFGRKYEENEFQFPGFAAGHIPYHQRNGVNLSESYESAYILRRVELNGRVLTEGQSPWSIRQTAVYHRLHFNENDSVESLQDVKSTFLLIAPSHNAEQRLRQQLELSNRCTIVSCNIQRLLVADSLRGWMDYMAWLETQLKEQSNKIVFARVGTREKHLSPVMDFNINFMDRQALKLLEDSITDLQIILPTCLSTVVRIREQCQKCCNMNYSNTKKKCNCDQVLVQFDEHIKELELYVMRVDVLRDKAKCIAQLLSDLLNYENAVALRNVAHESQRESKSMTQLTEKSTKDAAAVKVLTIIGLIYLPTTIVASFFSTQFVHTNNMGNMAVSANAWLLAAIAVPLTIITIATWWTWTHCKISVRPKVFRQLRLSNFKFPKIRIPRGKFPLRQRLENTEMRQLENMECGMSPRIGISQQSTMCQSEMSPQTLCDSRQGTWRTSLSPMEKQEE